MKILKFILVMNCFFLINCKKHNEKDELRLTLLNNYLTSNKINVVRYSLENLSSETYFINNLIEQQNLSKRGVYQNGVNLFIFDDKNEEIEYQIKRNHHENSDNEKCVNTIIQNFLNNKKVLGYNLKFIGLYDKNNIFTIHPKETIFFEYLINLNEPTSSDEIRQGYVEFQKDVKYTVKLAIASDSTNYKSVLPRDILQTIKANKVKVYHGIIESKNSVPVKIID